MICGARSLSSSSALTFEELKTGALVLEAGADEARGRGCLSGRKGSIGRTYPAKRTPRSARLPCCPGSPAPLGCNVAIGSLRARLGNLFSCQPQTINVKRDGIMHLALDLSLRSTGGNAARQIGRIGGVAGRGVFDNDQITVHLSPACFRILFFVPGARSWPGLPEIVTSPRLLECLYWRWLPRVRSRYQPSSSMSLMASRTFIGAMLSSV